MSRSLVGSSSSSTLGSSISRRSSCSRRRSPPDRSATGVHCAVADEAEPLAQLAGRRGAPLAEVDDLRDLLDRLEHPQRRVSSVDLLRQVGRPHGQRRCTTRPARRRQLAGQQPQQRRLARPVDADHADPVARAELPGQVVEQHPAADLDGRVLDVVDLLAEPRAGEAQQLDRVARRRLVGDEGVGRVDPEPRLGRARRRAAPQPGELLAQQVGAPGVDASPAGGPARRGPGRTPRSRPRRRAPRRRHLPGAGADRVEEPPVVGDDHDAPRAARTGARPASRCPRRRGGWSARRGRAGRARRPAPGQRDPAPLAAGQRPDRPVQHRVERASGRRRGPSSTSRTRASPAHSCAGPSPTHQRRGPWPRRRGRRPAPTAATRSPPVWVTRPASGGSLPGQDAAAASTCRRRCGRRRRPGRPRRRRARRRRAARVVP